MAPRRIIFIGLAILTIAVLAYFNYTEKIAATQINPSVETVTNTNDRLVNEEKIVS
jgi:hypothetical protein